MTPDEHQQVIDELQDVIDETQRTIARFEAAGMDSELPDDYDRLFEVLDRAIRQQREHALAML